MDVLAITNLFPDRDRPGFAPFNRQQLWHLAGECRLRIVSPVPWPLRLRRIVSGGPHGPPEEFEGRAEVRYPVLYYTPKILRGTYGWSYEKSIAPLVGRLVAASRPDVIYATWAYPDCFAAVSMGRRLGIPVVSRVHGSDVNRYLAFPGRRRRIVEAMAGSAAVVVVSGALGRRLAEAGVAPDRVELLYNGIDRLRFRPEDRGAARAALGLPDGGPIVLFAGNLNPGKGIDLLIEALPRTGTAGATLHILGSGPSEGLLRRRAARTGSGRVFFHGRVAHDTIGRWMNACDLFCLPSLDEGTPNVLLEALACRTPVVATDTGGIPEIVSPDAGILFPKGDAGALAAALRAALERDWDRDGIVCPAGSWEDNARALAGILRRAAAVPSGR